VRYAPEMQHVEEPELTVDLIRSRADDVRQRLRTAAIDAGRDPDGVRLVAVTKGFDVGVAHAAHLAGLTILGENRVQEAIPKVEALPDLDWHLIGRLQSNKARQAIRLFSTIHSVDSLDLLRRLDRVATEEQVRRDVLLQVNVSAEAAKAGFDADRFAEEARSDGELTRAIGSTEGVEVVGLMTMARFGAAPDEQHATFRRLRELRDALRDRTGISLGELSMGMTADAEAAVAEGATLVRIGTAIFGPRPHP